VVLTGATGYIGGRLAPHLLDRGYRVRCLVRDARKLDARPWATRPGVEVVECDIAQSDDLAGQMAGCDAAYYLIHSMSSASSAYRDEDRRLAESFSRAAADAGVGRIIYLGGLGEEGENLSEHLASRREVEAALGGCSVPVTVFRAAMIIGAGSASFEILRYLVERLPVMVTPRWVRTECQPIAVSNVVEYLVQALETPETIGKTLDVGGPDVMTYREIMDVMAEIRGLRKRLVIPVPLLTPRLSSLWIHLVTPVGSGIARPLAEGLRNRVVCRDDRAHRLMPQRLLTVRESIEAAVQAVESKGVEPSWTDAGVMPGDPDWAGGTAFIDRRDRTIQATCEEVFRAVCRVGGGHGYYAADRLWRLRGAMDRLVGGPGLRRGRRDPENIAFGESLDFWRVTGIEPERRLELRAEMKLPGVAQLSFRMEPVEDGDGPACTLVQTARFKPRGLLGILYGYAVAPLHGIVFSGMLDGIAREAERQHSSDDAANAQRTSAAEA